jgi:predicted MFS family arabinose efflux permease
MVSALTLFVAANILAAVAPGYAMMLIARVFAALGAAAFVPAASAVASSLAPAEYRGRALGTVVAGMTVAQVIGVPFGAFVGASLGWRYTFIFVAALGAAADRVMDLPDVLAQKLGRADLLDVTAGVVRALVSDIVRAGPVG